ncbi:putative ankyrin repeat-containing protein-like isoform 2 [Capsicum annuum]|nr:putative ankyrin repeat-containing protein-like isoform 2 [Capsicum annuum]
MDPTLYKAAMRGNIGDANFLLADHLKRDEEDGYQVTPKGNTVLHVAALYGHSRFAAEVLKITLASLCCQNKKNETALHIPANEGHTEVVRVLLACVDDHNTKEKLMRAMDTSGDTALHKAVRSQHLDVVKLLVKEDSEFEFPPNHAQETPLYLAAESGFHDALINILESCKKPTYAAGPSNRTPLHAAVIQKHKGCENDWTTAIHIAASEGDVNMIIELLNHFPDCRDTLNSNNQNALHVAVLKNQDKVVRVLLGSDKCDSLVDERDIDGNTPLHLLAAPGNHMCELINHPRAKKMSFNKENQTPLDIALSCTATTKKEKLVEDLCSIGRFGKRDFEVKRKYEYMPNPNDEMGTGVKMRLGEDDHDKAEKADQTEVKSIMKVAQIHIVVATLIMTITFAAGITLPGGFESDSDSPNQGMAILIRKTAIHAFVVSDAIAFTCSAVAIFIYFFMADVSADPQMEKIVKKLYNLAAYFQFFSMLAVVIAFATGMFATLSHSLGLAVTTELYWKLILHQEYLINTLPYEVLKVMTDSQMHDAGTTMTATSIATMSRTNAPQAMAPAKKLKKFTGIDFKRWQQKMFFYLTTLFLQSGTKTSKELWRALERKYKTEDAKTKKFFVVRFLEYKMIDNKFVVSQEQELQVIIHDLLVEGLIVNEVFQVAAIIEKLPLMWKDFKNYLKHKCKEMLVKDLIVRLHIEEDNKAAERSNQPKKKFKGKCFNCGKIGPKSTDCRAPKKEKKKDQENMAESKKEMDDLCAMLFECNLVGNPREWLMDSGATRYVCANKKLFSMFAPAQVEEMIYMANSATTKVEGTGKVCLKMTSGKVLTLNNVLYVPELRKNLISISLLGKNGFKCVFIFRKIELSK